MLKITIEECPAIDDMPRGRYTAVIWSRGAGTDYGTEGGAPIFTTARVATVIEAKLLAESAFGLLDWGKGGQPETQAVIALDY